MPKCLIVIRAKNEESWISSCLRQIKAQRFTDYEVVLVDNNSSDLTRSIAETFGAHTISIDKFKPGAAINSGLSFMAADYGVILSAHCVPVDEDWLGSLLEPFENEDVVATYGRQLPLPYTEPDDSRDLLVTFGAESKIQTGDYTFHNANSAIRLAYWNIHKFDDEITNVEDWLWASEVIRNRKKIYYSSEAAVWHYHGLHQHGQHTSFRANRVSDILKDIARVPKKLPASLRREVRNGCAVLFNYETVSVEKTDKCKSVLAGMKVDIVEILVTRGAGDVPGSSDPTQSLLALIYEKVKQAEQENSLIYDYVVFVDLKYDIEDYAHITTVTDELFESNSNACVFVKKLEHGVIDLNERNEGHIQFGSMAKDGLKYYATMIGLGSAMRVWCLRLGLDELTRVKALNSEEHFDFVSEYGVR